MSCISMAGRTTRRAQALDGKQQEICQRPGWLRPPGASLGLPGPPWASLGLHQPSSRTLTPTFACSTPLLSEPNAHAHAERGVETSPDGPPVALGIGVLDVPVLVLVLGAACRQVLSQVLSYARDITISKSTSCLRRSDRPRPPLDLDRSSLQAPLDRTVRSSSTSRRGSRSRRMAEADAGVACRRGLPDNPRGACSCSRSRKLSK